jgi:hypothetical protein
VNESGDAEDLKDLKDLKALKAPKARGITLLGLLSLVTLIATWLCFGCFIAPGLARMAAYAESRRGETRYGGVRDDLGTARTLHIVMLGLAGCSCLALLIDERATRRTRRKLA